eukprot:scaffold9618_cov123-Isochrysis_galbana.AAC.10
MTASKVAVNESSNRKQQPDATRVMENMESGCCAKSPAITACATICSCVRGTNRAVTRDLYVKTDRVLNSVEAGAGRLDMTGGCERADAGKGRTLKKSLKEKNYENKIIVETGTQALTSNNSNPYHYHHHRHHHHPDNFVERSMAASGK